MTVAGGSILVPCVGGCVYSQFLHVWAGVSTTCGLVCLFEHLRVALLGARGNVATTSWCLRVSMQTYWHIPSYALMGSLIGYAS